MSKIRKHYIVLSSYVDNLLQEQMPDVKLYIFTNIFDLNEYIESTPIRAEKLFITREVLEPTVHSNLSNIFTMLENPFIKVDTVEYVTEEGSSEIASIDFLLEDKQVENWLVTKGSLTREFVSGIITGSLNSDDVKPKQRVVYRTKRSDFLRQQLEGNNNLEGMDEDYDTEEDELADIPYEPPVIEPLLDVSKSCEIVNLTGLNNRDRTLTCFLFAQYLSHTKKTIIVEKDNKYLTLTDIYRKSAFKALEIDIKDLLDDPVQVFDEIKRTNLRLIIFTCSRPTSFNYQFVCTLLYANLKNDIGYLVKEEELEEVSETSMYTVILSNNVPEILKACEHVPSNYRYGAKFIMIDSCQMKETGIFSKRLATDLVRDVLQLNKELEVPVYSISSLKGGDLSGLRMYIN